jgi:FkbM family methyltransferase
LRIRDLTKRLIRLHLRTEYQDLVVAMYWRLKNLGSWAYEPECALLPLFIRPGDVVIDLGVNMGQYSSRMAQLVGPTGRVIGFEALESTFRIARRIVGQKNVEIHNIAVSDTSGFVFLSVQHVEGAAINTGVTKVVQEPGSKDDKEVIRVPSARLDDLLSSEDHGIAFVKCDIEGHEVAAIRGGMKVLARDRPVLLVETGGKNFRDITALLGPLGYIPKRLGPRKTLQEVKGEVSGTRNVFFVPLNAKW